MPHVFISLKLIFISLLFCFFPLPLSLRRLFVQTVSHEPLFGPEAVLESSKAWREHGYSAPQQAPCKWRTACSPPDSHNTPEIRDGTLSHQRDIQKSPLSFLHAVQKLNEVSCPWIQSERTETLPVHSTVWLKSSFYCGYLLAELLWVLL